MKIIIKTKLAERLKVIANASGIPVNSFIAQGLDLLAMEAEKVIEKSKA